MPVSQYGSLNTSALQVPNVYVQIIPPQTQFINGVPTNILGIVGSASWGPVNSPVTAGTVAQAAAIFGQQVARKYDLMTAVQVAALQGANFFKLVRVTDGTDASAAATVQTNCLTLTSKYTGSFGNGIAVVVSAGSQASSWKVVVSAPGLVPEVFDNMAAGLTGAAIWAAIAAGITAGANVLRPASSIITAATGVGTAAPIAATFNLVGGTDGAGVAATNLVGNDGVTPRTGMYALRNSQASVVMLCDCDTSTTWTTQVAYGLSEGSYMILTGPQGDTISNAVSAKAVAGIDSYAAKLMFGDWIYWQDPVNGQRLVSPQGFVAGLLSSLSPNLPALNSQLYGLTGTQQTAANRAYSQADLTQLAQAGIDAIINPSPGGTYFSCFLGHNTSSNAVIQSDSYTRMTNYIAYTISSAMGIFVGLLNSPTTKDSAKATLSAFFDNLWLEGLIGNPNSATALPYSVNISDSNNPLSREALGYLQADCQVQYYPIVEKFLINVQGGSSVQVTRQGTPTLQ